MGNLKFIEKEAPAENWVDDTINYMVSEDSKHAVISDYNWMVDEVIKCDDDAEIWKVLSDEGHKITVFEMRCGAWWAEGYVQREGKTPWEAVAKIVASEF